MNKKSRIRAKYIYEGLGFPVILLNVPMRSARGVIIPDINYALLQRKVVLWLCIHNFPLSGNQVRFFRQYLEMNYTEFGKLFGRTHAAVINWEKAKNASAKIDRAMELCIRLHFLNILKVKHDTFRNTFQAFDFSPSHMRSKAGCIAMDVDKKIPDFTVNSV